LRNDLLLKFGIFALIIATATHAIYFEPLRHISWRFSVTSHYGLFEPQYVHVLYEDSQFSRILIRTYRGEGWVSLPAAPLFGRTVILDAGHGYERDNTFEGYSEQERMLVLAKLLRPMLEAQGARVLMVREDKHEIHLTVRAAMINLWSLEELYRLAEHCTYEQEEIAGLKSIMGRVIYDYEYYAPKYFNFPFDRTHSRVIHPYLYRIFELQAADAIRDNFLMLSLHSNATPRPINTETHGADAYIMMNHHRNIQNYFANYASVDRMYAFSDFLLNGIHRLGIERRDVKAGNFFIIREHNLPGVLVENGFHTNAHDRALLQCDEFLYDLAWVYLGAIMRHFSSLGKQP